MGLVQILADSLSGGSRPAALMVLLVAAIILGLLALELETGERHFERVEAERHVHRVRQPPGEHCPARPTMTATR
jgi:hypothetical protein